MNRRHPREYLSPTRVLSGNYCALCLLSMITNFLWFELLDMHVDVLCCLKRTNEYGIYVSMYICILLFYKSHIHFLKQY